MRRKSTSRLFRELKSSKQVENFISENKEDLHIPDLYEYLNGILYKKGYSKASFVKRTGIDRSYVYHILAGEKRPSRDKLLIMSLALELELDEVQYLLKYGGFRELYVRDVRDGLIVYAINNTFTIFKTNELLHDFSKETLR